MTFKRLVTCAVVALAAALPASASAQLQVPPPGGDNAEDAINLGTLQGSPSVFGFDADTSTYTTQSGEFNQCGSTVYGKTVWSRFKAPRTGQVDVTAAGFNAVLGLSSLSKSGSLTPGPCSDRLTGAIESFPRETLPTVTKGSSYYLQVGGAQQGGAFAGGGLEVAVELLKPKVVNGADAGLAYKFGKGGIKITSVRIDGPKGSRALVFSCHGTKKCGKQQTYKFKSAFAAKPVLQQKIQKVDLARRSPSGMFASAAPKKADDAPLYAAARQVLKGRKIKNGDMLFVAVVAPNQIGQIFFWKIKKNAAGPKQIGCVEPTTFTIKAVGKCNGS
jgi:hypothetical protein